MGSGLELRCAQAAHSAQLQAVKSRLSWRRQVQWILSVVVLLMSCYRFCQKARQAGVFPATDPREILQRRRLKQQQQDSKQRILYIITSMAEYDNGRRGTEAGYDRFSKTIVPVARESVTSMVNNFGYHVDVYLVAHYNVSKSRYTELATALPASVGLQVWEDATPIGYALENSKEIVMAITRGLARQHRYIIKDKFFHYDLFVNFEDDMLIKGEHVSHFVDVTNDLFYLRKQSEPMLPVSVSVEEAADLFYGPMTTQQLARTIPGFMRVEAALPSFERVKINRYEQISTDYHWQSSKDERKPLIHPFVAMSPVKRPTSKYRLPQTKTISCFGRQAFSHWVCAKCRRTTMRTLLLLTVIVLQTAISIGLSYKAAPTMRYGKTQPM